LNLSRLNKQHDGIFKTVRNSISIKDLKKEQNFKGIDRKEFDKLVANINVEETFEELLAMLD